MKTLIILLLSFPALCFGQVLSLSDPNWAAAKPHAIAACTTIADDFLGSSSEVGPDVGHTNYVCGKFTAGSSYTACKVVIRGRKYLTPTQTITPLIYTDSSGPGAVIAGGTGSSSSLADWPATIGDITFTGFSASITNGQSYWLVLRNDSANHTVHKGQWAVRNDNYVPNRRADSADGSSWTVFGARQLSIQTYK